MRTKICVLVIFAFGLGFAGCKSSEQTETEKKFVSAELKKMQGTWKIVSHDGADEYAEDGPGLVIVIKDDILQHVVNDTVVNRQKMNIVPGTEPVQVDLVLLDEDGKPETSQSTKKITSGKKKDKTKVVTKVLKTKGIYSIEGDKLTFALGDDTKRPTELTPGKGVYLSLVRKTGVATEVKNDKDDKPKEKDGKDKKETDKPKDKDGKVKQEKKEQDEK